MNDVKAAMKQVSLAVARIADEGWTRNECRTLAYDLGRRLGLDEVSILEALNDGYHAVDADEIRYGTRIGQ